MTEPGKSSTSFEPLKAISVFLAVFGAGVMFAVLFTDTFHGRVVNAISGILLLTIALLAYLRTRVKK